MTTTTTINATLTEAYGVISGTVRGNESRTPVLSNIEVAVYNGSDVQVGSTAYTDANGFYSIGTIPTGTYRPSTSGATPPTW